MPIPKLPCVFDTINLLLKSTTESPSLITSFNDILEFIYFLLTSISNVISSSMSAKIYSLICKKFNKYIGNKQFRHFYI